MVRHISCSHGHQTFSWLGRVCRSMYAADMHEQPDKFSVAYICNTKQDVLLPYQHILDYCQDGDVVTVRQCRSHGHHVHVLVWVTVPVIPSEDC